MFKKGLISAICNGDIKAVKNYVGNETDFNYKTRAGFTLHDLALKFKRPKIAIFFKTLEKEQSLIK